MIIQFVRTNKKPSSNTYTLDREIGIGKFDIVANTRSFGVWANKLTDPTNGDAYIQGSQFAPWWPSEHVICLNGLYAVDRIEILDAGGGANFIIKSGLKFHSAHTVDANITLNQNQQRTFNLAGKQIRFVSLTVNQTKSEVLSNPDLRKGPSRIRIIGRPISLDEIPPIVERPLRTFPEMLGWNMDLFSDFNQNVYLNTRHNLPGTHFRIYDLPEKFISPDATGEVKFAFSNGYKQGVSYDIYFQQSKAAGITVIPTMIGIASPRELYKPSYDALSLDFNEFYQPRQAGTSSVDPNSYIILAKLCWEFANRYGYLSTTPSNRLDSGRETQNLFGTGFCNRLEIGNELDNWFRAEEESFVPAELAAMMSACIDGHCNTMGPRVGALNADSGFEMIFPAMADLSVDFYMAMYYWWKENRADGQPPVFSVNVHSYFNNGAGQFVAGSKMIAPELFTRDGVTNTGGVRNMSRTLLEKLKRYFPGRPIYITEFGCDTNKYSPVGVSLLTQAEALAAPFPLNSWQYQAAITIRTIFEFMADTTFDFATIFTLNDYVNTNERVERYSDVEDNIDTRNWKAFGYGADGQFATSGDDTGQYAFEIATSPSIIDVTTITVGATIVLTLRPKSVRPDFVWPSVIELRDPADNSGSGAHLFCNYINEDETTLTVQVANVGPGGVSYSGTGSFQTWLLSTPYAKKTRHYVLRNAYQVLATGSQKLIREESTDVYRHLVFGDSSRETHIIWRPTEDGGQTTENINFQRSTVCRYRNLEDKTFTSSTFSLTGTSANVVVNEMPKLFYFDLTTVSNIAPVVDVEANKPVTATSATITSTSSDPDGTVVSRLWTQISGAPATMSNITTGTLGLSNLVDGVYVFRLTVTDNDNASSYDDITITVSIPNSPPVVYGGAATVTTSTVTFYADATDSDGTIASRQWSQFSGPNTAIFNSTTGYSAVISGLINGNYVFKCLITDDGGASATSTFTCSVSGVSGSANIPPVVNVEASRSHSTASTSITSTSSDSDGTIASRAWTKVSGPSCTLSGTTTGALSVTGLTDGVYTFKLIVTDNGGLTAEDQMTLTVSGVGAGSGLTSSQTNIITFHSAIGGGAGQDIVTQVYLPIGYGNGTLFPVIVFCHGAGEKFGAIGNSNVSANVAKMNTAALPKFLHDGNNIPAVVIMPQIGFATFDSVDNSIQQPGFLTNELAAYCVANYSGDPQRCHLTGLSLGGQTACDSAINYPNRWATVVPMMTSAQAYTLSGPVRALFWFFISKNDNNYGDTVDNTVAWIDSLNLGGHIPFTNKYTVFQYRTGGTTPVYHEGWNEITEDTADTAFTLYNSSSRAPSNSPAGNIFDFMFGYKLVSGVVQVV